MEAEQFEEVWKRYRGRLLGFVRLRVSNAAEAEDILQEVFLRVHTRLCCVQEWTALEKWVFRVTRNLVVDHYRARRKTGGSEAEVEAAVGPAELEDDPAARIAFSLRDTVDELPEPYREALVLTEYEGLSQAALAERAGLSLSGAKSRVQRARARLKALLLACCHFELDRFGRIVDYHERCCCSCPSSARPLRRPGKPSGKA